MSRQIIVIAHNMRSTHNVGSLLRTADGLGITEVFLTGYTPYPLAPDDKRLPHEANKIHKQISKTALGAETSQVWQHTEDVTEIVKQLRAAGYTIAGLEQTPVAVSLPDYTPPDKLAIILGEEVAGIPAGVLALTDLQLVIPMSGQKESFNVVQAAAMALYHCKILG
ncbi:MAG: TrmH family RNA methyltransferase [Candidatus Saccharimonadales bacterium]